MLYQLELYSAVLTIYIVLYTYQREKNPWLSCCIFPCKLDACRRLHQTEKEFDLIEKGRYLTRSYVKRLYLRRSDNLNKWKTQKRHQNVDYTTSADRIRTAIYSNFSHPTCVVKVYGIPASILTKKSRVIKRTHILKFVNTPLYRDRRTTAKKVERS